MKYLAVITGPTAIGKTTAAIEAARYFNTEIISADSRQLYRELVIGTAAPEPNQLAAIKHHFVHSRSVSDAYNASYYESEVLNLLDILFTKYNIVILTGGSMLYIDAVCKGIDTIPDIDPQLRSDLKAKLKSDGIENLRRQLKQLDPDYYLQADLRNPARIVHALEVCLTTGSPYSSFRKAITKSRSFKVIKTALNCERADLHNRINTRVDEMITKGLEAEAESLFPQKHMNSLNTVGYREFFDFFEGKISKEKAIELIKRNTRRYARKQLTWFRKDPDYRWFKPEEIPQIIKYIETSMQPI